jgi:heterodisulfide reductase subunit B
MPYALYPGCLILQRMQAYEVSARLVLEAIGIPTGALAGAACCGAPVVESISEDWLALAAYNLALAARDQVDILTLCGSCTNTLRRAHHLIRADGDTRARLSERLQPLGLRLEPLPEVHHLLQVLIAHQKHLAAKIVRPVRARVAVTYPCQVFRPAEVAEFDHPLRPQAMRRLAELAGAQVIRYDAEYECCGSTLLMVDESLALEVGRRKLVSAQAADVIVDACGNCQLILERHASGLTQGDRALWRPTLFISQLLGLALGLEPDALGVRDDVARQLLGQEAR